MLNFLKTSFHYILHSFLYPLPHLHIYQYLLLIHNFQKLLLHLFIYLLILNHQLCHEEAHELDNHPQDYMITFVIMLTLKINQMFVHILSLIFAFPLHHFIILLRFQLLNSLFMSPLL